MMCKKILSRASLVCGASCIVIACVLAGCGKRGAEADAKAGPSDGHMRDPQLKERLRAQISEREVLLQAQQTIIRKMETVAAKYNGDLKAAAADPEMISLIRRARDIEMNFSSNRTHSAEMIRARANGRNPLKKEVK